MPNRFHFLVVDDIRTIRMTVTAMLNQIGFSNVSEAEDGAQALKLLQESGGQDAPINFIVTDWNMPIMNGLDLLKAIRGNAELMHLPVLMVTTDADNSRVVAAAQAGADGLLIKPLLNVGTLRKALDGILKARGKEGLMQPA